MSARSTSTPSFPVPWGPANAQRAQELIGEDFWPYGIDPNRATLEAFVGFAHDQGVCAQPLAIEELFVPERQEAFRI